MRHSSDLRKAHGLDGALVCKRGRVEAYHIVGSECPVPEGQVLVHVLGLLRTPDSVLICHRFIFDTWYM